MKSCSLVAKLMHAYLALAGELNCRMCPVDDFLKPFTQCKGPCQIGYVWLMVMHSEVIGRGVGPTGVFFHSIQNSIR